MAIYAVNRPMRGDTPGELFSAISTQGYTFPVLLGNQVDIDALGVTHYPTVLILDKSGHVVFRGTLDMATKKLERLLAEGQ